LFLKRANDDFLVVKSLITNALDKGILLMEDGAIYHGEVVVGHTKDLAASAIAEDKTLEAFSSNQPDFDGRSVNIEITKKERSGDGRRGGKKPSGKKDGGGFGSRRSSEGSSKRSSDSGRRRSSDRPDRSERSSGGERKSSSGFGRKRRES